LTINANTGAISSTILNIDPTTGVAVIDATTGTGPLAINIDLGSAGFDRLSGNSGNAIRTNAGGDAEINIISGNVQAGLGGTVLDLTAVGEITVNNSGTLSIANSNSEDVVIRAAGGSLVLNNNGVIRNGALDFSGLAGGYVFNNNAGAVWQLGSGLNVGIRLPASQLGAGILNNAGTIQMGAGDSILAQGTSFTGIGDSLLEMARTALDGKSQLDCTAPTEAGCIDLSGGSTSGQTRILALFWSMWVAVPARPITSCSIRARIATPPIRSTIR
jgi:hypothetical protein